MLDTSGAALEAGLHARPAWVKVNDHEARQVLGLSVFPDGDAATTNAGTSPATMPQNTQSATR